MSVLISGRGRNKLSGPPVVLHRDWAGAWRATVRAGLVLVAIGLIWAATGWSAGPFLLLGVSIMASLFSIFDNPAGVMRFVFVGQVCGASAALACRFLVWPLAGSELQVVLLTTPFILAAALFFSHRRILPIAFDYAMVSLLLLRPAYPPTGSFMEMLAGALAVVAAPLIGMFAYRFIFPLDDRRRLAMLVAMMVHEVQDMARAADAAKRRSVWRAQLYHRLLRLIRLADKSGSDRNATIDGGLSVLALGSAVLATRDMLTKGDLPTSVSRSLNVALERLACVARTPEKAVAALSLASKRLSLLDAHAAETLTSAARALATNNAFFHRTG